MHIAIDNQRSISWQRVLGLALSGAYLAFLVVAALNVPAKDLFPLWAAARGLLAGQNPYGAEIQAVLAQEWWNEPTFVQAGVVYPLPMIILVLPLALLPYATAKIVFIGLTLAALIVAARLMRLPWIAALCFAPVAFGALLAQVTPLWGALAVVLLWAVRQRRAPLIGLCLVLLPAKPQAGLVLALLVAGWCLWRERRALMWALVFGLPLWGGSVVLLLRHPDWLHDWLTRLALYSNTIPSNLFILYAPAWVALGVLLVYQRDWVARAAVVGYMVVPQVGGYSSAALLPTLGEIRGWPLWLALGLSSTLWMPPIGSGDAWMVLAQALAPLALGVLLTRFRTPRPPAHVGADTDNE